MNLILCVKCPHHETVIDVGCHHLNCGLARKNWDKKDWNAILTASFYYEEPLNTACFRTGLKPPEDCPFILEQTLLDQKL